MKKLGIISSKFIFILGFLACFVLLGCNKNSNAKKTENTISIVTTTFPCYDAVRAVLGELINSDFVELKLLVKPGTEVHSYDPSPSDLIAIKNSDLFVYVGGESDSWIDRILHAEEDKINSLELIDYVDIVKGEHHHEHEHSEECDDDHESEKINRHEIDEHIWTSPINEIKIIDSVCEELKNLVNVKNHSEIIGKLDENAKNYISSVEKVSEEIKNVVNKSNKFIVVADRFPLVYFAQYFGIEYIAAFSGCSTAIETSTATISELIETVKNKNLDAVYYMELGNHKIADIVAEACGVESLLLQSVQNVTRKDFENGETWVSLMERNKKALEQGFN